MARLGAKRMGDGAQTAGLVDLAGQNSRGIDGRKLDDNVEALSEPVIL